MQYIIKYNEATPYDKFVFNELATNVYLVKDTITKEGRFLTFTDNLEDILTLTERVAKLEVAIEELKA